jgi:hypothetical protein
MGRNPVAPWVIRFSGLVPFSTFGPFEFAPKIVSFHGLMFIFIHGLGNFEQSEIQNAGLSAVSAAARWRVLLLIRPIYL